MFLGIVDDPGFAELSCVSGHCGPWVLAILRVLARSLQVLSGRKPSLRAEHYTGPGMKTEPYTHNVNDY